MQSTLSCKLQRSKQTMTDWVVCGPSPYCLSRYFKTEANRQWLGILLWKEWGKSFITLKFCVPCLSHILFSFKGFAKDFWWLLLFFREVIVHPVLPSCFTHYGLWTFSVNVCQPKELKAMHTVAQKTTKVANVLLLSQRNMQTQITVSRKMNKLFDNTMWNKTAS